MPAPRTYPAAAYKCPNCGAPYKILKRAEQHVRQCTATPPLPTPETIAVYISRIT